MQDEASLLERFRRSLVPLRILNALATVLIRQGIVHLDLLRIAQAELLKAARSQTATGHHIHSDTPGVQLGAEGIEHGADHAIGQIRPAVLVGDGGDRIKDLVRHGEGSTFAVPVESVLLGGVDVVGATVRHDHDGRNLNVVLLHPVHHELGSEGQALHRRRTVQGEHTGSGAGLLHIGFVDVRAQTLTLGRIVLGGCNVHQPSRPDLHGRGAVTVHQGSVPLPVELIGERIGVLLRPCLIRSLIGGITESVDIGVAEHLKRNLRLLAEPHQLENLKVGMADGLTHAAAEVKHEHDAVVLAVLLDDLRQEDIVMGAVLVEAVKVQHPGLLRTLTADLVRCLLALKLGDHLTHERIGLTHELPILVKEERVVAVALVVVEDGFGADDVLGQILDPGESDHRVPILLTVLAAEVAGDIVLAVHDLLLFLVALLATLRSGLLHLLADLLHGRVIVQELGDLKHLIEIDHGIHHVHDLLLRPLKGHGDEAGNAPLEVDVDAVEEPGLRQVHLLEAEQVKVCDLLVTQEEVAASAGELLLHQLLNADIFDDVGDSLKEHGVVAVRLRSLQQLLAPLVGSPHGVADLVGHEHGLDSFGHIPHGHDEVTRLHIERCGFSVLGEGERNVLGCESAGEDGERGVHAHIVTDAGEEVNPQTKFILSPITSGYYQAVQ